MSQRFQPNAASANRENLLVGLVVLIAVPLLIGLRGERDPVVLITWGAVSALASYAFYTFRSWRSGIRELTLDGEGLTLVDRTGTHTLAWTEVQRAEYLLRMGSRWVLHRSKPQRPFVLWLDVFSDADGSRISELVRQHVNGS